MYNAKEGLWWRDQDFDPPYKEPNGKNCYWSRGNGWVYAALVRVLDEIPADETHRQDYINDFLTMSKALKQCQRTDGFWNVSLHDESNFGGKELRAQPCLYTEWHGESATDYSTVKNISLLH